MCAAMKNINTIDMEMLSKEQIDAARQRRSMERWALERSGVLLIALLESMDVNMVLRRLTESLTHLLDGRRVAA